MTREQEHPHATHSPLPPPEGVFQSERFTHVYLPFRRGYNGQVSELFQQDQAGEVHLQFRAWRAPHHKNLGDGGEAPTSAPTAQVVRSTRTPDNRFNAQPASSPGGFSFGAQSRCARHRRPYRRRMPSIRPDAVQSRRLPRSSGSADQHRHRPRAVANILSEARATRPPRLRLSSDGRCGSGRPWSHLARTGEGHV